MEARKITVVSTRNQKTSVIMSAATTLAELKAELRNNGIDYSGMTFFEGTSRVELKDDASVLPHDVPYKGTITNELVFMLTTTDKKIRSGADMSRSEVYAKIKELGLQNECQKKFGKNFTMCKTADLISLVTKGSKSSTAVNKVETKAKEVKTSEKSQPKKVEKVEEVVAVPEIAKAPEEAKAPVDFVDVKARQAILTLVSMLEDAGVLEDTDVEEIEEILEGTYEVSEVSTKESSSKDTKSAYSKSEIDGMFDFIQH